MSKLKTTMNIPDNILNFWQNKKQHKNSTINLYWRYICNVYQFLDKISDPFDYRQLANFSLIKQYLEEHIKIETRKIYVIAIRQVLEASGSNAEYILGLYDGYNREIVKYFRDKETLPTANEKELENYISIEEICKIRDSYKKEARRIFKLDPKKITQKELSHARNYIILSLYTRIPPARSDYVDAQFYYKVYYETYEDIAEKLNCNFIDMINKKVVFAFYKTDKIYEIITKDLPDILVKDLIGWQNINTTNYVLRNLRDEEHMSESNLTQTFNRIFNKKKISVNMIRKIFVSDSMFNGESDKNMKEFARVMGHSMTTQQMQYNKFRKHN